MRTTSPRLTVRKLSIGTKLFLLFAAVSIMTALITGYAGYRAAYTNQLEQLRTNLMVLAQTGVIQIDPSAHDVLKPGDEGTVAYQSLRQKLITFQKATGVANVYTFRLNPEGKPIFVLDAATEDQAAIGDSYEMLPAMKIAFSGQAAADQEPIQDQWGIFLSGYAPIIGNDGRTVGLLGVDEDISNINAMAKTIIYRSLLAALLAIVLGLIISIFISRQISLPLKDAALRTGDIARNSGDLTQKLTIQTGDELEYLGNQLNLLMNSISVLVSHIRTTCLKVSEHTESLLQSAEERAQAMVEVSASADSIAQAAGEQVNMVRTTSRILEDNSHKLHELVKSANHMSEQSNTANILATNGLATLENLKTKNAISNRITEQIIEQTNELNQHSQAINQVNSLIGAIASQTNLLALNAAIEAARAGEAGRGFAVVAEEVRLLADRSRDSAGEITELVSSIQQVTLAVTSGVANLGHSLNDQNTVVEQTANEVQQIIATCQIINQQIGQVMIGINHLEQSQQTINRGMQNLEITTEQMSSSTMNINAATQQQTASVEDVTNSIHTLNQEIAGLSQLVSVFIID